MSKQLIFNKGTTSYKMLIAENEEAIRFRIKAGISIAQIHEEVEKLISSKKAKLSMSYVTFWRHVKKFDDNYTPEKSPIPPPEKQPLSPPKNQPSKSSEKQVFNVLDNPPENELI